MYGIVIASVCGCNKKVDNSLAKKMEQKESQKEKIKKLTQNDDLLTFLKTINNKISYKPVVTGESKSNNYSASVESHLLYFEDEYIYDIVVDSSDKNKVTFDNISSEDKENNKYKISELKLESNDEEIYLKALNNENKEYIMSYPYYSSFANSMHIQKTWTSTSYTNYDYYYTYDDAMEVSKAEAKAFEAKKKGESSIPTVGMSSSEVESSKWGKPDKINKDTYSWGTSEQWVYNDYGYVYIKNGKVTSVSKR